MLGLFTGATMVVCCQHGRATQASTVPSHIDTASTRARNGSTSLDDDSTRARNGATRLDDDSPRARNGATSLDDALRVDTSTRARNGATSLDDDSTGARNGSTSLDDDSTGARNGSTRLDAMLRVDDSALTRTGSTRVDDTTWGGTRWLVIAPHPDDESLMAGGVLFRAIQAGAEAAVVVVTNGDLDCLNDGARRQGEAVAALSILGLPEDRAYFLGYPDGGLALLGRVALPPRARILDHACVSGNTTYGARGFGHRDYHSARLGAPALYTRDNAESDLATLLQRLRPTDVVVSHPDDTHPDHVATYSLFRSALDRIIDVLPEAPRVHRAMVHNGDCWPTGNAAKEPCPAGRVTPELPLPPLTGRLSGYLARERFTVPTSWQLTDLETNPKARAIAAHSSQTRHSAASYLFSFVRSDEAFFPEWLGKVAGHWRRIPQPTGGVTQTPIGKSQLDTFGALPQADGIVGRRRPLLVAVGKGGEPAAPVHAQVESLAVPLAVSMRLLRPSRVDGQSVARLELLGDDSGAYALVIDADRSMAALSRTSGSASELLHEWSLPHDAWQDNAAEDMTVAIERYPEEGPVAEFTLYCRDDIVGVVTDVQPRLQGDRFTLSNVVTADGNLTVWAKSKLGAVVAAH